MKNNNALILITVALYCVGAIACFSKKNCFDAALFELHKNDICTMEWRGVVGCDGKKYGNECQANALGIRLK